MATTPVISTARAYFEHIKSQNDPFKFLSELPSPPRAEPFFEEEWVDFKGKPHDEKGGKKLWSKSLAGFANVTDGLVIWGIDARKTQPRNIDAACGLRLIFDPSAFESSLRDWIRDATNPPVTNVEYFSVPGPTREGFVVCLIPESNHKPHRAEFAGKQYYFRAGDDFLPAEPGLLRTLFYPQTRPFISVKVKLSFKLDPADLEEIYRAAPSVDLFNTLVNGTSSLSLDVILHNSGSATAKDLYILVESSHEMDFYPQAHWRILPRTVRQTAFQALRPIHPGETVELFSASLQGSFHNRTPQPASFDWEIIPHFQPLTLRFLFYAEGSQEQGATVEFRPEDLRFDTASAMKEAVPVL